MWFMCKTFIRSTACNTKELLLCIYKNPSPHLFLKHNTKKEFCLATYLRHWWEDIPPFTAIKINIANKLTIQHFHCLTWRDSISWKGSVFHELQAPAYTFSTFQYPSRSSYYEELNFCGVCHGFLTSPFIYTGFERTSIYQWDADMYTQTNIGILYALTEMTWLKLKVQWILLLILLIFEDIWVLISVYRNLVIVVFV